MPDSKRRLVAILSADVKGYSRLMEDDEAATVATLKAYRRLFADAIAKHGGRVVDSPGDNLLAEFASVVDAVQSAVEIQEALARRNADLPDHRRMEFRIGVNLGDVIEEGDRIYGDGVNIVARIEGLAEGGGICVSSSAYEQVRGKLDVEGKFLGLYDVKNISQPVKVYSLLTDAAALGRARIGQARRQKTKRLALRAVFAGAVAIVAILAWNTVFRPAPPVATAPSGKPSIAVLPFDNLSGDPEQEYFSDGMTEDILTDLSKVSDLFVIARNSSFQYKGQSVDVRTIADDLGVRYVLEGSVRRAGDQVRINAQLIDATTGGHLWADRFDGVMDDVFALQDRVAGKIVAALAVTLTPDEQKRLHTRETDSLEAYDAFLKGWDHLQRFTPEDVAKAKDHFETAIELDPEYGRAYAALAWLYRKAAHWSSGTPRWTQALGLPNGNTGRVRSHDYLREAIKRPTALAYQVAAIKALYYRRYEEARAHADRAVEMDPNDPSGLLTLARVLIYSGDAERALGLLRQGLKLDPRNIYDYLFYMGYAHFAMGNLEEAAVEMERARSHNPEVVAFGFTLGSVHALLGRDDEARREMEQWRKSYRHPATIFHVMEYLPFRDLDIAARFAKGLALAGLPGDPDDFPKVLPENRLSGEEIRELIFGHTRTGVYWGLEFRISVDDSGNAFFQGGFGTDRGKTTIENDQICMRYRNRWEGRQVCYDYYRNPEGTADTLNEYFSVSDLYIVSFSVVE